MLRGSERYVIGQCVRIFFLESCSRVGCLVLTGLGLQEEENASSPGQI